MPLRDTLGYVRYFTDMDPYIYFVDNRPLGDLAFRDEELADAIDSSLLENVSSTTTSPRVLTTADIKAYVRFTHPTDNGVLIVPSSVSASLPIGAKITVRRMGTGTLEIDPAVGVTLNVPAGKTAFVASGGAAYLVKVDTDEWDLFGDLV